MSHELSKVEAAALKREHTSLTREIADWRQWWKQLSELGEPHFGEMGDRLAQFREHLAAHFSHEERLGCLSLVIESSADEVAQIAELRDEHARLLSDLNRLVAQLHQCEPEFDCWGEARKEFELFLDRLNAHEDAEDALLDRLP